MKRLFARACASLLAVGWAAVTLATPIHADEGWVITSFNSVIKIAPDSNLDVTEDIRVDFGALARHGIFRTIPLRYRYDDKQDRLYGLSVTSVTDGSRRLPFTRSISHDNTVIKIGDPSFTVTGANRYVLNYTVSGAMNSFADHDELFWNVDGGLWPVAKRSVSSTVLIPSGSIFLAVAGPTP